MEDYICYYKEKKVIERKKEKNKGDVFIHITVRERGCLQLRGKIKSISKTVRDDLQKNARHEKMEKEENRETYKRKGCAV